MTYFFVKDDIIYFWVLYPFNNWPITTHTDKTYCYITLYYIMRYVTQNLLSNNFINAVQSSIEEFEVLLWASMWKHHISKGASPQSPFISNCLASIRTFIVPMWWPAVSNCEYWILITVMKLKTYTTSFPQENLIMAKYVYIKISSIIVLKKYVRQTFISICVIAFIVETATYAENRINHSVHNQSKEAVTF